MNIGRYRIDGAALLGRILFRWHWKLGLIGMLLLGLYGVLSEAIPPIWRGETSLAVQADPHASILVDGKPWPFPVYAGWHRIEARYADGRRSWTDVVLQPNEEQLVILPPGAPTPRVRPLPPPAPGNMIKRIWWADNGWRVQSGPIAAPSPLPQALSYGPELPIVFAEQTVALTSTGLEPLATLDAYGGKADVLHHQETRLEAVFRAAPGTTSLGSGESHHGTLEVRGGGGGEATIPMSHTLTVVRWAPHGNTLLVAEQVMPEAEHLSMLQMGRQTLQPVVTIPGRIENIIWSPAGDAAVVMSQHEQRMTLTLVRTEPTIASRVIAEVNRLDQTRPIGAVVPLTWSSGMVEWIAPDERGQSFLWRARVAALIPEQVQPLTAVAIQRRADGVIEVMTVMDGRLVLGRPGPDGVLVQAEIPEIPATPDLVGHWSPAIPQVMLQSATRTWIVDLQTAPASATEGSW